MLLLLLLLMLLLLVLLLLLLLLLVLLFDMTARVQNLNQNDTSKKPPGFFNTTFKVCIGTIGQMVVIFSPWKTPNHLTRIWCAP